jgi:vitamin B12 transporter
MQTPSRLTVAGALAAAAAIPAAGAAQAVGAPARDSLARDTAALRPVVVTATRLAVPQAAPTASATVITGAELRARGITHLADALRDVPNAGVLQNGSFGATTSLFLRGGDPKYVQVLVDGVPVNEAGGSFNYANLTTDNVERVEVLRGPASVLYGSDAVTGVVQVFTRRGAGAPRASFAGRGGSYGTAEGEASASGADGRLGWSAGAARYGSDGILAFNNRYRNESANASLRLAGARGDATLAVRAQRARYNYPTNSAGLAVDSNAFRRDDRATVSLDAGRFVRPSLELRTQLGVAGLRGGTDDRRDNAADTVGFSQGYVSHDGTTRRNADVRANWYLAPRTVLTVGGDYRGTRFRNADSTVVRAGTSAGRPLAAARDNRAAYAQFLGEAGGFLTATLGARYDDNSAFGAFRTVRAGLGAALPGGASVRVAAGNAFREPTMLENFARSPFNYGNPALRPERTRSFEAGVTQRLAGGRATLGATYYLQRFRDVVQYGSAQRTAAGDSTNYFNVTAANGAGVELEARAVGVAGFDVGASYARSDTRVTDAGLQSGAGATFVVGSRLLRRPAEVAALTVSRALAPGGSVALRVNYTGRRDDRNFNAFPAVPLVLPSFTTVNLAAEYPVLRRAAGTTALTITARAENLLGREYEPILGFRAPGRTVLVGARIDAGR